MIEVESKTQETCVHLMQALRTEVNNRKNNYREFDMSSLSDQEFEDCTRLCRFEFQTLMQASRFENQLHLFIFLTICFWGISQRAAGIIFAKSQSMISKKFNEVLNHLSINYVPKYLGIGVIPREDIIENHTPFLISKCLPYVRLIEDSTHIYIQKPSDFEHQKMSYYAKEQEFTQVSCICSPRWSFCRNVRSLFLKRIT